VGSAVHQRVQADRETVADRGGDLARLGGQRRDDEWRARVLDGASRYQGRAQPPVSGRQRIG
jgi:hypothetical protein